MNLIPVNGHLLIEPVKHESFMASQKGIYEEIGIVVAVASGINDTVGVSPLLVKPTDRVFFDSWLAAKFPKNDNEFYWLVKWEDVRAIEHAEISE